MSKYSDFRSLSGVKKYREGQAAKEIRHLSRGGWGGQNALWLGNEPVVLLLPHNDGMPTCPFVWYRRTGMFTKPAEIINNQTDFTQIANLAEILNKTADVMQESYDRKHPVAPFRNFGLLLADEVRPDYSGRGEFVFIDGYFIKRGADPVKISQHCCNDYLDIFIGWNFGDVVRQNEGLEKKLNALCQQLIADKVRREKHATGFEVTHRKSDTSIDNFYNFAPFN